MMRGKMISRASAGAAAVSPDVSWREPNACFARQWCLLFVSCAFALSSSDARRLDRPLTLNLLIPDSLPYNLSILRYARFLNYTVYFWLLHIVFFFLYRCFFEMSQRHDQCQSSFGCRHWIPDRYFVPYIAYDCTNNRTAQYLSSLQSSCI
jgi:hypothetical protein